MIRRKREMQISERELTVMTAELDEIHHATLPVMQESASALGELLRARPSRRGFLVGVGALGAASFALAACGDEDGGTAATTTTAAEPTGLTGDLAIAALAASLENLAVDVYQAALDGAGAGSFGAVPPAIATFASTVQQHHRDHAAAWNSVLTNAGESAVTGVDLTVKRAVVDPGLPKIKTAVDLGRFALTLEDVAAATYLNGIQSALESSDAIKIAATIHPVEMQHSAILHFVLGEYPVPDTFAKIDGARGPDDEIG